jgi:hypothetical protein
MLDKKFCLEIYEETVIALSVGDVTSGLISP